MSLKQVIRFLNQPIKLGGFFRARSRELHPSKRLLNLLYGDRTSAMRQLEAIRAKYPGRSNKWINDKVIEDLIRDRAR